MQPLARRLARAPGKPRPDRPVPIALVITELDPGGAERALVALATGLDRARWAPHVIALGPEAPLVEPLRAAGVPTTCLGGRGRDVLPVASRLVRTLRRIRPALVQSFLFHANVLARLAGPLAGRPWVVGGLRVAEREQLWHHRLERATAAMGTGSVCVSEAVRRFAIREMGLPEQRLTVIPNGVDLARIDEAAPIEKATLGLPETARIALFIGRLTHQKGVDVLLAAAREVLPAHPDWRLVLVGDGPERQAVLSTIQADPRLATHAHWLGRRDDVPRLLRTADLLVLPSRWEGMPNVVLEAMAARCPVVATDVEGCDELVLPLRSGWLVEPGNPDRLARALSAAMADPGERAHHAAIARRIVAAQYTTARMIAAYDRLWSRLLGYADDTPEPPAPAEATE